jgi:type IV pilus assembly protein PilW
VAAGAGFTLVELLVVIAIAAITTAVIYSFFPAQYKVISDQEAVSEMQQQLRAAMKIISTEIKMAGHNPNHSSTDSDGIDNDADGFIDEDNESGCASAISRAEWNLFSFTLDSNSDGDCRDPNDNISYFIQEDNHGRPNLRRATTSSSQTIAANIQVLGFAYAFDNDGDHQLDKDASGTGTVWAIDTDGDGRLDLNLDTNHDGQVNQDDDPAGEPLATAVPLDRTRAVAIWLLARTKSPDSRHLNTETYSVANQRITTNDGYRRRLLSTIAYLRNMGL